MAVTKIIAMHQNEGMTISKSISNRTDYGMNPQKTENGKLVSSFACDPHTVVSEFVLSKKQYHSLTGRKQKNDILAYQVRQSFKPNEITPEEAHKIGYEFAERFLKGKHAFIVCTHTDKAHIHNHIYFNSTTLDCKRKFRDKFFISKDVARLSDLICIEHSLSVVENPQRRNTAYNKWEGYQKVPSLRDLLRNDIDEVLKNKPKDFDDFISQMKDKGYSIKFGKHITFANPRQRKNIRLRSLGKGYSEEEIKATIRGNKNHREKKNKQKQKSSNLLIDVQQKLAEGKGKGYENWAKVFNLKQMAKTVLYLQENGFADYDEFSKMADEMIVKVNGLREEIKTSEKRIDELTVLREQVINYLNTRETFAKYKASGYSKKFYAEHESEIILHRAAKNKFNELGLKKLPTVKSINSEYSEMTAKKKKAYSEYYSLKDKHREMLIHKSNIETILGISSESKKREKTKDKTQETIS